MIGFLRLGIILLITMAVLHLLLRLYLRSLTRERLERRYDAAHPGARDSGRREAFVAAGLRAYEKSMGRKLLWGVFVLPVVVIGTLVYVLNFT